MPGIFSTTQYFGSAAQTLHTDPPTGFTVLGASGSWLVHDTEKPNSENTFIDQSVERIYSGTSDSHLQCDFLPDSLQGTPDKKYSAKMLVKVNTSATGSLLLCIIPDSSTTNHGYAVALRPNSNHFDIVKITDYGTVSDLQTSTFTFSSSVWYVVHFKKEGDNLKASIWEWGDSEPSWMVTASDSSYAFSSNAYMQVANVDSVEGYIGYMAAMTSDTLNADDPPDPTNSGDGAVDWNFALPPLPQDWLIYGEVWNRCDVDMDFAGFTVFSDVVRGDCALDFADFFVTEANSGDGDIQIREDEWCTFAGYAGGKASLNFEMTPAASGKVHLRGSGEVTFPSAILFGDGIHSKTIEFAEFEVDGAGGLRSEGWGSLKFTMQLDGAGRAGNISLDDSNVNFPGFSVRGISRSSFAKNANVSFPTFSIAGSNLGSVAGDGELKAPNAVCSGDGTVQPMGDGDIDLDFTVWATAHNGIERLILRYGWQE